MKYCLITFRSVTPAQRGEGILNKAGIHCVLGRTPKYMEQQGCGYSLRLLAGDSSRAAELLRQRQISFRKVYLLDEAGGAEELSL